MNLNNDVISLVLLFLTLASCTVSVILFQEKKNNDIQRNYLHSIFKQWKPTLGIEVNLAMILERVQEIVDARNYSFYIYNPSTKKYTLKAVRQLTTISNIAPSYSGLLPYEKERFTPPISLTYDCYTTTTTFLNEGEVPLLSICIKGGKGIIRIGPLKTLSKRKIKTLETVTNMLEVPLQNLLDHEEKNRTYEGFETSAKQVKDSNLLQVSELEYVKLSNLRKDRLLLARNYSLYYGNRRIDELAKFDLVIVEPKGHSINDIKQLKEKNTLVITYLSLMEVHPTEPIFKNLTVEDFLHVEGKPYINESFGTYLVNLQSITWMNYLLKVVKHQLNELESDGIFLDTIGDIEMLSLPNPIKERQLKAAVNFLYVIKLLYPYHLIIQNNGLESVCLHTAPYIDGICWENPPVSLMESKPWVDLINQRLSILINQYDLKILLLLEETTEKKRNAYAHAKKLAKERGYILYNAPNNYVEGVNML